MSRVGGVAAIIVALSYVAITALYIMAGAVPDHVGRAWLEYLDGQQLVWWSITGLSILTDVLFLVVAASLYVALRSAHATAAFVGTGLLAIFAILDLAVTWPNYAALITLSGQYGATSDDARRVALAVAANVPAAILGSGLFAVYAILVPSVAILVLGWVMRRGSFGQGTAYLGVLTGILGIVAVLGPYLLPPLGAVVILTSILTALWVLLVGIRLLQQSRQDTTFVLSVD
jgi:hypothetical protein